MSARKLWWLLLIVVGVPVVALAWWLGLPLFLDRAVDEEFPRAAGATVPSNLTLPEVEQVLSAMAKVQQPVEEAMPTAAAPQPVKRGQFRDADSFHLGSGRATIYRLDGGGHLLRLEDFQVTNGPDLRVLLSSHAAPASRDDLQATGFIEIGRLKGNVGDQNYPLPASVKIDVQRSVVIYCKPFHVVFTVATLNGQAP